MVRAVVEDAGGSSNQVQSHLPQAVGADEVGGRRERERRAVTPPAQNPGQELRAGKRGQRVPKLRTRVDDVWCCQYDPKVERDAPMRLAAWLARVFIFLPSALSV